MKQRIIVCAAALCLSVALVIGAECPTGPGAGLTFPLYAWSGEGPYVPAGAPQVGTVVLNRLQTGELVVHVRLDDGEPCMTFSVYSEINGSYHPEDVALMTTNLERMGETCASLSPSKYGVTADTFEFQVLIEPTKSPAPVAYATLKTLVSLSQIAAVSAAAPPRPAAQPPGPGYPAPPPQMPCYAPPPGPPPQMPYCQPAAPPCQPAAPPCQPRVAPCRPMCDPYAACGRCGPYWWGGGYAGPGPGPYGPPHPGPPQPGADKVVVAQEFRLVDQYGRNRGALRTNGSGLPELTLWDAQEQPRAVLTLQTDGSPQLDLLGPNSRSRLALAALSDGSLSIAMMDERGQYRTLMGLAQDGTPILQLMDQGAQPRAELYLMSDGKPQLRLYDAGGKAVFSKP